MKSIKSYLIILLGLNVLAGCQKDPPHLKTLWFNRVGVAELVNQQVSSAQQNFVESLVEDPFLSSSQVNLGLTFELNKEMEKALASYRKALELAAPTDFQMQFISLFNVAQIYQQKGEYALALEHYQKALKVNPVSKEVKTNIELMIKQQEEKQQGQDGKDGDSQDQDKDKDKDKDDKKDKDQKDKKDPKDQKDQKDPKDDKDQKNQKDKKDKKENRKYKANKKQEPAPFKGNDLSEGDVRKILGELKQQEQKIRADYYNKEVKESPNGKDW